VLDFARELVSIPSPSGGEGEACQRCAEELRSLGFDVEVDDHGNVLGIIGGPGPRLLFDGHVDTVAPNLGWTRDPYAPTVQDGRLYGLGAVDMKGPIAAMIHGVSDAARAGRLEVTVGVSVSTLEEVAEGAALAAVVDDFHPDAVVIAEPSGLQLMLAQKGRAELELTVRGVAAHAAFPERGASALLGAVRILTALEARVQPVDDELGAAILVATEAVTDPLPGISVVPSGCRVRLDRRTLPGESDADVLGELEPFLAAAGDLGTTATAAITEAPVTTYTGRAIPARRFLPAWRLDRAHPLAESAASALREALGGVRLSFYRFCTNASLTAGRRSIPTIGFGPGDSEMAHQADEWIALEALERGRRGFAALAGLPPSAIAG
jgi:putative selenium metabolism hydrolase